jgi:hypothetical protein
MPLLLPVVLLVVLLVVLDAWLVYRLVEARPAF